MILVPDDCVQNDSDNCGVFIIAYVCQLIKYRESILAREKAIESKECNYTMGPNLHILFSNIIANESVVLGNDTKF